MAPTSLIFFFMTIVVSIIVVVFPPPPHQICTTMAAAAATTTAAVEELSPSGTTFRAILAFGDSTVDSGNNNYINTLFKANYLPYGQDFPGHVPTGRFTNGKLVTDIVASFLGIKDYGDKNNSIVPPFLDPSLLDDDVCTGVSFASAGSGYDDWTTKVSRVIPVSQQIDLFKEYIVRLKGIVGEREAGKIINGAFVIVSAATNDFIFNFYDIPTRRLQFTIGQYQDFILLNLENFIKELYDLGCRTMVIAGLPPMGCLPIQMTAKLEIGRKCLDDQNWDAQEYNRKLKNLLPQLQRQLPRTKIVYADIYQPMDDMINHPHKYGFVEAKRGCCGTGLVEVSVLCNPITPTCGKASEFVFWDSIHPGEAAYQNIALYLEEQVLPQLLHA